MDFRSWLRSWLMEDVKDWTTLDTEYRAGRIDVEQYMKYKERLMDRRTSTPSPYRKTA